MARRYDRSGNNNNENVGTSWSALKVIGVFIVAGFAMGIGKIAYRLAHDAAYNAFSGSDSNAQKTPADPNPAPNQPQQFPAVPQGAPKQTSPALDADSLNAPFDVDPAVGVDRSIHLVRFTPFAYQNSPWKLGMGVKGEDLKTPIAFQQKTYSAGISMHPPIDGACRVSFVPGKQFKRFKGWGAIGDHGNPGQPVLFAIWGDGKKLWESGGLKANQSEYFDLDVTGVKVLVLETRMQSGHHHAAYAVWLDPWLEK